VFGGKASQRRAPLADVVPELALALTPVLGSMFSLSSSKMKKSADSCSVPVSFEPGAICAAATVTADGHLSGIILSSARRLLTWLRCEIIVMRVGYGHRACERV